MSKVTQRRDFLNLLGTRVKKRRDSLIDIATADEIQAIIEALHNLLQGHVEIPEEEFEKLKKYRKHIREIADKKQKGGIKKKKKILKQHGGLLPIALPLILSSVSGLVSSLFNKR